ncbi:MAG: hypothetical protein AAGF06_00790 [Pseudomonadota bacterium]
MTLISKNALNITALCALVNITWVLLLPDNLISINAFKDNGTVSHINMALILAGAAYTLWLGLSSFAGRTLDWFCVTFIFQIYLLREANFHESFSSLSLTQWKSYTYPDIPLTLKLVAAMALLLLFMSISYLLARYIAGITRALTRGSAWAIAVAIWAVAIIVSQFIDRKIAVEGAHWKWSGVEEMIELGAAVFALLALIQFVHHYQHKYKDYFS